MAHFVGEEVSQLGEKERRTFFYDALRAGADGVGLTLTSSVFLVVGIQLFNISDLWKSLITSSIHMGMILSLFTSSFFSHHKPSSVASLATLLGGGTLLLASLSGSPAGYGLTLLLTGIALNIRTPLLTRIYAENYDPRRRGKLYAGATLFSLLMGLASNVLFGFFLDRDLGSFRGIFAASAALTLFSGVFIGRIPLSPRVDPPKVFPLKNLALLVRYPLFGWVSLSWFLMGFANLWAIPLRAVYLAEKERGLGLGPLAVLFILGILPSLLKFSLNNIWARAFDRFHFLPIRLISSLLTGTGTLLFFLTDRVGITALGHLITSIGLGAAPFLWNLWVTQVAPPGETQRFMSVHTFLCGLRGVLGPFVGFFFISYFPIRLVGVLSFALTLLSVLILLPLINRREVGP